MKSFCLLLQTLLIIIGVRVVIGSGMFGGLYRFCLSGIFFYRFFIKNGEFLFVCHSMLSVYYVLFLIKKVDICLDNKNKLSTFAPALQESNGLMFDVLL